MTDDPSRRRLNEAVGPAPMAEQRGVGVTHDGQDRHAGREQRLVVATRTERADGADDVAEAPARALRTDRGARQTTGTSRYPSAACVRHCPPPSGAGLSAAARSMRPRCPGIGRRAKPEHGQDRHGRAATGLSSRRTSGPEAARWRRRTEAATGAYSRHRAAVRWSCQLTKGDRLCPVRLYHSRRDSRWVLSPIPTIWWRSVPSRQA